MYDHGVPACLPACLPARDLGLARNSATLNDRALCAGLPRRGPVKYGVPGRLVYG